MRSFAYSPTEYRENNIVPRELALLVLLCVTGCALLSGRQLASDRLHIRSFRENPGWIGQNNRPGHAALASIVQDFGYSPDTHHAGGEPGEVGGLVGCAEAATWMDAAYYADRVDSLSLSDRLHASARIAIPGAATGCAVLIGWFHSHTCFGGVPPRNFLGILVEGSSHTGYYLRPAYANNEGIREVAQEAPLVRAGSDSHQWAVEYDPSANDGQGEILVTLDAQRVRLALKPGAFGRPGILDMYGGVPVGGGQAMFDRFGILSCPPGGQYVELFLDDLEYTANRIR